MTKIEYLKRLRQIKEDVDSTTQNKLMEYYSWGIDRNYLTIQDVALLEGMVLIAGNTLYRPDSNRYRGSTMYEITPPTIQII